MPRPTFDPDLRDARLSAATANGPRTVLPPYRVADRKALQAHGFLCL